MSCAKALDGCFLRFKIGCLLGTVIVMGLFIWRAVVSKQEADKAKQPQTPAIDRDMKVDYSKMPAVKPPRPPDE